MERKSDIVRKLVSSGDFKSALKIAKDFKLGIPADKSEQMKMAYECLMYPTFYKQIGIDVDNTIEIGIQALKLLYG